MVIIGSPFSVVLTSLNIIFLILELTSLQISLWTLKILIGLELLHTEVHSQTYSIKQFEKIKSSKPNNLIILNDLQKTLLLNDLTMRRVLTEKLIPTRSTKWSYSMSHIQRFIQYGYLSFWIMKIRHKPNSLNRLNHADSSL